MRKNKHNDSSVRFLLTKKDLTQAHLGLVHTVNDEKKKIFHFTSPYAHEGASQIAFEVAQISALAGNKVLFVDMARKAKGTAEQLRKKVQPLDVLAENDYTQRDGQIITSSDSISLDYVAIQQYSEDDFLLTRLEKFKKVLHGLRHHYDYIYLDAPNILGSSVTKELVADVDGVVLVIEAEKTRAPVAMRSKKKIVESGGILMGAVLNKRRYYIPSLLYRMFYK
jgi:protein-tyrosine kinase